MIEALAPIGLISVTATLLAVPVMPALYELHKRGDVSPLPTSRHDGRIENFADAFRSRMVPLLPDLEACCASRDLRRTELEGAKVLLVGSEDFDFDPESLRGLDAVVCSHAQVPAGKTVAADIYSSGNLSMGEDTAVRAAVADGNITIASGGTILRWMHAGGNVYLKAGSSSYGRLSSGDSIYMAKGSHFQRVRAQNILTVDSEPPTNPEVDRYISSLNALDVESASDAGHSIARMETSDVFARPRVRVRGDFVLPPGEITSANVIATGDVRLRSGSRFRGCVKSYRDTIVDESANVHGSIVCGGALQLGANSFVVGPLMAEGEVRLSAGARIGAPDSPTTISCSSIRIASGCQIHGTIWARIRGTVED